jgi:COP9 signalosome complex subunit 3
MYYFLSKYCTVIKISHKTSILACQEGCAELLVRCLIRVCDLVSPQSTCLSSIHADVLQTCISAKMYTYAHSFISIRSITEICPSMSPLSSADFLRFFYYSGIVHIALEEYQQALVCFDQVISTPASCISAIAIEAYKKALLVSLITQGQRYQVPV